MSSIPRLSATLTHINTDVCHIYFTIVIFIIIRIYGYNFIYNSNHKCSFISLCFAIYVHFFQQMSGNLNGKLKLLSKWNF